MKNVFLALAFMLIGTFAFASTNDEETVNENIPVDVITNQATFEDEEDSSCFDFYDSCGGAWEVCHSGVSTAELVAFLWAWDGGC